MTTRRGTAPRKRPASASAGRVAVPAADKVAAEKDGAEEFAVPSPQETARELLSQIDGLLRDEPSIDEKDREAFTELFAASLREVVDSGEYANVPSEAEWQRTLDALKQQSSAGDSSNGLARQLNSAIASLDRRETKLALEFSRRMQAEGQQNALAWLREQQSGETGDSPDRPDQPAEGRAPLLRSEVTQSRSRRLRGPPKIG